jgi:hypothetical protein
LSGRATRAAGGPATTFERVLDFVGADFDEQSSVERVFEAAAASAAFPLAFAPMPIPPPGAPPPSDGPLGPCFDGGIVNNTPIKYAIEKTDVDHVVVVTSMASLPPGPHEHLHGVGLLGRVADMLVNERMYRDLKEVDHVNQALRVLKSLGLPDDVREKITAAFVREGAHEVDLVPVQPDVPLKGNAFDGFFDRELRVEYLDMGRRRGGEVLSKKGWPVRKAQDPKNGGS